MLSRVYIDNFKSLVNFDYEPGRIQLILGANGSGKSTLFEAVSRMRRFLVRGVEVGTIFNGSSLTRWDTRNTQVFETTVDGNGGQYLYRVEVEHHRAKRDTRLAVETLSQNGRLLYAFREGEAQLFRDDFSEGPRFPSPRSHSGLFSVPSHHDNTKLTWFKSWMENLCCVRIDSAVEVLSDREEPSLEESMNNFSSWYRHLIQESPDLVAEMSKALREGAIEGFESMSLGMDGEGLRSLIVTINVGWEEDKRGQKQRFSFNELSDGQRVLIVLYALAFCALRPNTTLLIDDSVIHVALDEIQPWLMTLLDRADTIDAQVLLISHHPELINYLAREKGVFFRRDHNGPTRVGPAQIEDETGLTPAELIARGWVDG